MDDLDAAILDILRSSDPLTPTEVTNRLNDAGYNAGYQKVQRKMESLNRFRFIRKEPFQRVLGGILHRGYVYSVIE